MSILRSLLVVSVAVLAASLASAADLGPRASSAAGVSVKVTPGNLSAGAAAWEFAVVFDTHSEDLNDDLLQSAVLIDARGNRHAPLAWEGTPPGWHHRSGVLRFQGLATRPEAVELLIHRPGESAPRSFRWELK